MLGITLLLPAATIYIITIYPYTSYFPPGSKDLQPESVNYKPNIDELRAQPARYTLQAVPATPQIYMAPFLLSKTFKLRSMG